MESTTNRPTAQHPPASGEIEASAAQTRRVRHLSAVVRDNIEAPGTLDQNDLAMAVVKALYDAHPRIRLEDALELAVIIGPPTTGPSTSDAIEQVVADACAHLDEWDRFELQNLVEHP